MDSNVGRTQFEGLITLITYLMKYFFWILSLLMNGMLFASCDNDSDESVYSCNKTITVG